MQSDTIIPPDMPAIDGLRFRFARGEADAEALCAVHTGRMARDGIDPHSPHDGLPGVDEMRATLAREAAEQRQDQRLIAEIHGQVVGYSTISSWTEDDGRWVYLILGWVLPEWRGRGLGTAMLHWGEELAWISAAAQHPGEPFEFAANASSTEHDSTALLLHEGYRAGYTVLEMGLDRSALAPVRPLPEGIEVRPVLPEYYLLIARSIAEAYQHEYADNRFQETYDPAEFVARLSEPGQDPTLWQVAWDGDQIAGQVLSVIEDGQADVFEVSVHPAWRRRGLALALLTRALHTLQGRSVDEIRLRTTSEFRTRAKDLYHSVGFRVLKTYPRYRKSPG